ncbi:MAG TPA: GH3 auxin-responsive promoter family protein, partial [Flavobacteriales bacterium]|nr:GH3 auxin-responsive promoter family protein [Flavobacteriales bacterium]
MSLKAAIAKPYARMVTAAVMRRAMDPVGTQLRVLRQLLELGEGTYFGRTHGSGQVHDHAGLVQAVPLRDYEGFRPYIDRIIAGESDVLWPGVPLYLCKTSGTTSGAKYI